MKLLDLDEVETPAEKRFVKRHKRRRSRRQGSADIRQALRSMAEDSDSDMAQFLRAQDNWELHMEQNWAN